MKLLSTRAAIACIVVIATIAFSVDPAHAAEAGAPANDECSGAETLLDGVTTPFDTTGATSSLGGWLCPSPGLQPGPDVWFEYTVPPGIARLTVGTCGSSMPTVIEAYRGSCSGLVPVDCGNDGCGNGQQINGAVSVLAPPAGETYFFRVGGDFGFPGAGLVRLDTFGTQPVPYLGTPFGGGGLGLPESAVYFDLDAIAATTIDAIETNLDAGPGPFSAGDVGIEIYTRPGTHVGNETSAAGWSLAATDDGTAYPGVVNGSPTRVYLDQPWTLPAGRTGVAVVTVGARPSYSVVFPGGIFGVMDRGVYASPDGNLRFTPGSVTDLFGSGPVTPQRLWNGRLLCAELPESPNRVRNGSFETGDFDGWNLASNTPISPVVFRSGATNGSSYPTNPTHGGHVAIIYYGFGSTVLSQVLDVTEDACQFQFDYRASIVVANGPCCPWSFDLVVRDVSSGAPLLTSRWLTADPGTTLPGIVADTGAIDLHAFIGQQVELSFEWRSQSGAGGGYFQLDNVRTSGYLGWPMGEIYCPAVPHAGGQAGAITAFGSTEATDNSLTLAASNLPSSSFGLFLVSSVQTLNPGAGGASNGNLCLGNFIGRLGPVLNSELEGAYSLRLDLRMVPQGGAFATVVAGEVWNFQSWFRDPVGLGSNFTDAVSIAFE